MGSFFESMLNILQGFITSGGEFLVWLTTPLEALEVFGWELSPLAIFGFSAFIVVFTMVIIHLFNPVS